MTTVRALGSFLNISSSTLLVSEFALGLGLGLGLVASHSKWRGAGWREEEDASREVLANVRLEAERRGRRKEDDHPLPSRRMSTGDGQLMELVIFLFLAVMVERKARCAGWKVARWKVMIEPCIDYQSSRRRANRHTDTSTLSSFPYPSVTDIHHAK